MARNLRLDRELLVKLAPNPGYTENYNHEGCPAGEDRRQRLYITTRGDGTILGYCHNCGSRGYHRDRKHVTNIHHATAIAASNNGEVYATFTDTFVETADHGEYLEVWSVNRDYANLDGWTAVIDRNKRPCWLMPIKQADVTIGKQHRFVDGKEPKVLSYGLSRPNLFNPLDSNHVVICEDRTSGVRVVQDAGVASLCLHGSKALSAADAHALTLMFDYVTIWYDMDSDVVIEGARLTERNIKLFTNPAHVYLMSQIKYPLMAKMDPKRFDKHQLAQELSWPTSRF